MSSNWLCVVRIFFIMGVVLISGQGSSGDKTNDTHQILDNGSISNLSIPSGFETDFNEARRLEELRQQNSTVIEDLIGVYENILARLQPGEYPLFRADIENRLGNAYNYRNLGDKAGNIDRTIELYNNSSRIFTREADPVSWAMIEYRLGNAYRDRIRGNHSENIEMAIQHFNNSLQIFTRDANPINWASTEDELGAAYYARIRGDRDENIETAIRHYNNSLQVFTRDANPSMWAQTENDLGIAYRNRIRGDRAENIEMAIRYYNNSLKVYIPEADPVNWALTENNLAIAYRNRIRGNHSENIEMAIQHFNNSLQVFTREGNPIKWASIENDLGNAYSDRIRGDRAENLEMAIQHFNNTLQVYTHNADPIDRATTELSLGTAYYDRIRGDRAENIEMAIQHFNNSLQVYDRGANPSMWAATENNLGNAYLYRIRGDRAENIETAIGHYNNSLQVFTRDADPVVWAGVEINLGTASWYRIRGDKAENIETAIRYFNNSLQVFTRDADPLNWARAETNLGIAYKDRIRGDKAVNLEMAIQYLSNTLQVVSTPDVDPENWAKTEGDLGIVYRNRIRGDRAENIEMAIRHYNNSLQLWTRDADPLNWAQSEYNLGNAYRDRIRGNGTTNIETAIRHYQNALQIRTNSALPRDFRNTERNLGNLYFGQRRWQEALDTYKKAIAVGEQLYRSGLSAESKSGEVKENSVFYRNASFAAARLNKTDEALLILEQGKTRLLTEALRLSVKRSEGVPDEAWSRYEKAAETYRTLQATPPKEDSIQAQADRERKSQEALDALDAAIKDVQNYVPSFQKSLELSDIQNALDNETALLSFCVTNKGSVVFVVTRSGGVKSVDVPGFNTTDLDRLIVKRDSQGNITGGWIGNMSQPVNKITQPIMQATIDQVLAELGQKLIEPAIAEIPENITNLILLPSGSLFLVPIHAAPVSDSHELLSDRYVVSYAPSIELLIEMKEKAKERTGKDLYEVVNPTGNLDFAPCEGENISRLFMDHRVDVGQNCTLESVLNGTRDRAYLHFASHGEYNWNDPPQSALKLYNGSLLTLADLQENDSLLLSSRLVTLSACETGITDVLVGSADEYVGLPAGFMVSGAPCVVSSLWPVEDVSTSLLIERFYFNHITKGMDIPSSLQEAQQWVRDLTNLEVSRYVNECFGSAKSGPERYYLNHYGRLASEAPNATPFAHPYYWAGFTVNGV